MTETRTDTRYTYSNNSATAAEHTTAKEIVLREMSDIVYNYTDIQEVKNSTIIFFNIGKCLFLFSSS